MHRSCGARRACARQPQRISGGLQAARGQAGTRARRRRTWGGEPPPKRAAADREVGGARNERAHLQGGSHAALMPLRDAGMKTRAPSRWRVHQRHMAAAPRGSFFARAPS
ncbi:hypothetical protein FGB62_42g10 [Gracilaria domingensis]|nr:hypothetical protein FGB62_42g10 [Gracilaria domingensis]